MVIWCWLFIHSSANPKTDYHQDIRVKGIILEDGSDLNKINFADDFEKKHIDTRINNPIRWVKENDCLYAE